MAAIVGTYGMVRMQTLAFLLTMATTSDTVSNADLLTTSGLAALTVPAPVPPSALKSFLGSSFLDAAAANAAFRALGGQIIVRQTGGTATPTAPIVGWIVSSGSPVLSIQCPGGASNEVFELIITLPHSIIQ